VLLLFFLVPMLCVRRNHVSAIPVTTAGAKGLPGTCRDNFNYCCFRMHSHAERGKEGNTIFPWLHELNELRENLIYVAQCKTRGIFNRGGFGTRPYRFTPQCTSINQSLPHCPCPSMQRRIRAKRQARLDNLLLPVT